MNDKLFKDKDDKYSHINNCLDLKRFEYLNRRDFKFRDFSGDISDHIGDGSISLGVGQSATFAMYEQGIAEFSNSELNNRDSYHNRSLDVLGFAKKQLDKDDLSVGIQSLLIESVTSTFFQNSNLYDQKKDDIDVDLFKVDSNYLFDKKEKTVKGLIGEYIREVNTGNKTMSNELRDYAREHAFNIIEDYVSKAEHERFGNGAINNTHINFKTIYYGDGDDFAGSGGLIRDYMFNLVEIKEKETQKQKAVGRHIIY